MTQALFTSMRMFGHFGRACMAAVALTYFVCAGTAHAQQQVVTRVVGRVLDHRSGEAVAGASVRLGEGAPALADRGGWFTLHASVAGTVVLHAEMIGYASRADTLQLVADQTSEVTIRLTVNPIEMPPLVVSVRSAWLEQNGFFERRLKSGLSGRWITRDEIERRGPTELTDMFHDVSGAKVHKLGLGATAVRFTGYRPGGLRGPAPTSSTTPARVRAMLNLPGCEPALYIDGQRRADRIEGGVAMVEDFNVLSPAVIEAIEVYVGLNTPIEFRNDGCGVILLWTRRGR